MKIFAIALSAALIVSITSIVLLYNDLKTIEEYAQNVESAAYDDCRRMLINQTLISEINGCVKTIKLLCQESFECQTKLTPICEEVVNF